MPLRILAYAERVRTALDDMLTRSGESHPELLMWRSAAMAE
jgi:hypothetical protein